MGDDDGWGQEHRRQSRQPLAAIIHTCVEELFHNHISKQAWLDTSCGTTRAHSLTTFTLNESSLFSPHNSFSNSFYPLSFLLHFLPSPVCTAHLLSSIQAKKKNVILTCGSTIVNSIPEV